MHTRVIGVGNAYRSDDGAGLAVARALGESSGALDVRVETGEGTSLMEAWEGAENVIIVDAVRAGANAGSIHRIDAIERKIPSGFLHYSTHAFGVAEAIELARALGTLPKHLTLYGIVGATFEPGTTLSKEVETAVQAVADEIRRLHSDAKPITT